MIYPAGSGDDISLVAQLIHHTPVLYAFHLFGCGIQYIVIIAFPLIRLRFSHPAEGRIFLQRFGNMVLVIQSIIAVKIKIPYAGSGVSTHIRSL